MPPKGKKGKSGKNKSKGKEKGKYHQIFDQKLILEAELDRKVRDLAEIKIRIRAIQEENTWLNEEANRIGIETTKYGQYMSKKANLRQNQIVTLSDYHKQEIEDLHRDKENMLEQYQRKKQVLRAQLVQKGQFLREVKMELEAMEGYKAIRDHQSDKIERLQDEIARIRRKHVHEMADMKFTFEKEIEQQRSDNDAIVKEIRQQANQEADQYVYHHTLKIQNENVELTTTLQDLLRRAKLLSEGKQRLEEEQLHLIYQLKLAADLKRIRLNHDPTQFISSELTKTTSYQ